MLFSKLCPDLGQTLNGLRGPQLLGSLAPLCEVLPYDLANEIGNAPPFLLGDFGQGLVLFGFQQPLRSVQVAHHYLPVGYTNTPV
jgi:hypothetical protein